MSKKVMFIERSELARNIYSILLSKLGDFSVRWVDFQDLQNSFLDNVCESDIVIASESSLYGLKDYLPDLIKKKKLNMPILLLVQVGMLKNWKSVSKFSNVAILERPFLPEDFLDVVNNFWRNK